ncbi:BURP domain protein RD22-like [Senna tora]|uniref:BURP domain protein RD22-like n=1 Tax=Senna tora TaxID=362788 RepID=A0A834SNP5_9FABA|nr:BURP domain protein RD22-like [Senna tora]
MQKHACVHAYLYELLQAIVLATDAAIYLHLAILQCLNPSLISLTLLVDDIFKEFSINSKSEDGEMMKKTIEECEKEGILFFGQEEVGIKGEEKYCATSLESMLDFATSRLGNNLEALSTQAQQETARTQEYTVARGVKRVGERKAVVCHKRKFPYAVFYCHKTETTVAYTVLLEGADGTRVKAVAVCHADTSEWNPEHLAFQVLNVKPGSVPVCHFLSEGDVLWVPKHN